MEKSPRTKELIDAELKVANDELFRLEQSLNSQHEETGGTSMDDNSQEAAVDDTKLAILRMRMEGAQMKIRRLEEELRSAA